MPPLAGSGFAGTAGSVPDARFRARQRRDDAASTRPGARTRKNERLTARTLGPGRGGAGWAPGIIADARAQSCSRPALARPSGELDCVAGQGSGAAGGAEPLVQHRWGCWLYISIPKHNHTRECTGKPFARDGLKPAQILGWQTLDSAYRQWIDSRYGIRKRVVRTDLRRRDHAPAGAAGAAGRAGLPWCLCRWDADDRIPAPSGPVANVPGSRARLGVRTHCGLYCGLSLSAGLGGAQVDGPGPDQHSDRPVLASVIRHRRPEISREVWVCDPPANLPAAPPSSQGLESPSWSPGQGCLDSGRGSLVSVLPRSSGPGANCLSIAGCPMPLSPEPMTAASSRAVRQQTFLRTILRTCSPEGSAEPKPGAGARLSWQCRERVAPFRTPPGRCSLHGANRAGCPSRSSRYTGVERAPLQPS